MELVNTVVQMALCFFTVATAVFSFFLTARA
jgi:hypothetical protein